jgi:hypothetical protein
MSWRSDRVWADLLFQAVLPGLSMVLLFVSTSGAWEPVPPWRPVVPAEMGETLRQVRRQLAGILELREVRDDPFLVWQVASLTREIDVLIAETLVANDHEVHARLEEIQQHLEQVVGENLPAAGSALAKGLVAAGEMVRGLRDQTLERTFSMVEHEMAPRRDVGEASIDEGVRGARNSMSAGERRIQQDLEAMRQRNEPLLQDVRSRLEGARRGIGRDTDRLRQTFDPDMSRVDQDLDQARRAAEEATTGLGSWAQDFSIPPINP